MRNMSRIAVRRPVSCEIRFARHGIALMLKYSQISTLLLLTIAGGDPLSAEEFSPETTPEQPGLVSQDFIYHDAPFEQTVGDTVGRRVELGVARLGALEDQRRVLGTQSDRHVEQLRERETRGSCLDAARDPGGAYFSC